MCGKVGGRDWWEGADGGVEVGDGVPVAGEVLGEEELVGGAVLAEAGRGGVGGVHEGGGDDGEGGVHGGRLLRVEDEVRVLDQVHPEAEVEGVVLPR